MTLIEDAHRILDAALEEYEPTHVFVLTSGGNDSIVPLHLFRDHPSITAAVHIDTGIKAPDVEPHVQTTCDVFGLPLLIYRAMEHTRADGTPDPQNFDDFVRQHGFPGPAQHTRMYNRLKERQIERLIRDHKRGHKDRIALITGVRKHESRRRMGYVEETQRFGARVWVAPVANWTNEAMALYRKHYNLPENPASKHLGMSGECLCGAFAKPGELDRIAARYPELGERLRRLERESPTPWGYDGGPASDWVEVSHGQGVLGITPLCTSCIARGRA
jgi:3'-phosphoadenosine 5'-phosphosulfate sulfotransferase (PAPS reductase)/FAD synthetase